MCDKQDIKESEVHGKNVDTNANAKSVNIDLDKKDKTKNATSKLSSIAKAVFSATKKYAHLTYLFLRREATIHVILICLAIYGAFGTNLFHKTMQGYVSTASMAQPDYLPAIDKAESRDYAQAVLNDFIEQFSQYKATVGSNASGSIDFSNPVYVKTIEKLSVANDYNSAKKEGFFVKSTDFFDVDFLLDNGDQVVRMKYSQDFLPANISERDYLGKLSGAIANFELPEAKVISLALFSLVRKIMPDNFLDAFDNRILLDLDPAARYGHVDIVVNNYTHYLAESPTDYSGKGITVMRPGKDLFADIATESHNKITNRYYTTTYTIDNKASASKFAGDVIKPWKKKISVAEEDKREYRETYSWTTARAALEMGDFAQAVSPAHVNSRYSTEFVTYVSENDLDFKSLAKKYPISIYTGIKGRAKIQDRVQFTNYHNENVFGELLPSQRSKTLNAYLENYLNDNDIFHEVHFALADELDNGTQFTGNENMVFVKTDRENPERQGEKWTRKNEDQVIEQAWYRPDDVIESETHFAKNYFYELMLRGIQFETTYYGHREKNGKFYDKHAKSEYMAQLFVDKNDYTVQTEMDAFTQKQKTFGSTFGSTTGTGPTKITQWGTKSQHIYVINNYDVRNLLNNNFAFSNLDKINAQMVQNTSADIPQITDVDKSTDKKEFESGWFDVVPFIGDAATLMTKSAQGNELVLTDMIGPALTIAGVFTGGATTGLKAGLTTAAKTTSKYGLKQGAKSLAKEVYAVGKSGVKNFFTAKGFVKHMGDELAGNIRNRDLINTGKEVLKSFLPASRAARLVSFKSTLDASAGMRNIISTSHADPLKQAQNIKDTMPAETNKINHNMDELILSSARYNIHILNNVNFERERNAINYYASSEFDVDRSQWKKFMNRLENQINKSYTLKDFTVNVLHTGSDRSEAYKIAIQYSINGSTYREVFYNKNADLAYL